MSTTSGFDSVHPIVVVKDRDLNRVGSFLNAVARYDRHANSKRVLIIVIEQTGKSPIGSQD